MSSDKENEYFSDGITEEILNALSKIEGLHVTARTSSFAFKNQNIDVREIGKKLNVALLLEGSIRKSENLVRITAQLTNTSDGYHIWSDTWDRELKNIFIVQDEIAAIIAEKINKNIKPAAEAESHIIENTEAFDWYLKGQYLLNKWDFYEGENIISFFEKSIMLDPKLIKAYIGLSNAYTWLGSTGFAKPEVAYEKVEFCIRKVLELDKNNPDVYTVISGKNFWIEWDLPLALRNINRSLALKPSNADALLSKGLIQAAMGNVEQALDHLFQAERLNPYATQINSVIGMLYNYTNDNLKALEYIEKNIKICPYWYAQYLDKVEILCKLKRYDEALETITMLEADPNSPLSVSQLRALYYASQGKIQEAYQQLELLNKEIKKANLSSAPDAALISTIYLVLGEKNKALDYLEYGLEHNATPFLFIRIISYWDGLRNHPRYISAMKKIKFSDNKPEIDEYSGKYSKSVISKELATKLEKELTHLMNTQKIYLNPTLNLSDLAESLDISTNHLSQILNEFIGKNFYDYVNNFRLQHFLKHYKEPSYKNYTLLSVAYECGFNSKTTFNTFFKRSMGKTPSEYFKEKA
ncbi:MAG: helix-turn-helix domain-containing protein [Bacteroidales bacterium]|nr:helix-turn-helix domain-containing protein [Bacteroidales bacterium]